MTKEERANYSKDYYHAGNKYTDTRLAYQEKKRKYYRDRNNARNEKIKMQVLEKYSPATGLGCCFEGCTVSDVDMLAIDHIHNNGNIHRKELQNKGGSNLYRWLVKNGFPDGFQTLCCNHNMKKALTIARQKRKEVTNEDLHTA